MYVVGPNNVETYTVKYKVVPIEECPKGLRGCKANVTTYSIDGGETDICGNSFKWAVRINHIYELKDGRVIYRLAWSSQCNKHWRRSKYGALFEEDFGQPNYVKDF